MEVFILGFALLVAKDLPGNFGLIYGGIVALLALFASALLRFKFGWVLGWSVQFAMILYGFIIFTMFFMGALFLALWIGAIVIGAKGEAARAAFEAARGDKNPQ